MSRGSEGAMSLYLSSEGTPELARFVRAYAIGPRTCLVATAAEALPERDRLTRETRAACEAAGLVIDAEWLGLDDLVNAPLADFHVVVLGPGDPFHLLNALRDSGAELRLRQAVQRGTVVVGIGAGALALGPSLEAWVLSSEYEPEDGMYLEGLNLTGTLVLPHHNDPERARAHRVIVERYGEYYPVVPLNDGEAVIVSSEGARIVGAPQPA